MWRVNNKGILDLILRNRVLRVVFLTTASPTVPKNRNSVLSSNIPNKLPKIAILLQSRFKRGFFLRPCFSRVFLPKSYNSTTPEKQPFFIPKLTHKSSYSRFHRNAA